MKTLYTLIHQNESILLTKNQSILLPTKDRVVDAESPLEEVNATLKKFLINLNAADFSDYLIARIRTDTFFSNTIIIHHGDIDTYFCLNDQACDYYRTTINPDYCYTPIAFEGVEINIDQIISLAKTNKTKKIIKDVLGIDDKKIEELDNITSTNPFIKKLSEFKREIYLPQKNDSFINDIVTVAILAKNEDKYKKHKSGVDIASQSRTIKLDLPKYSCSDISGVYKFLKKAENIEFLEKSLKEIDDEKIALFNSEDFSYSALAFIYLKSKYEYIKADSDKNESLLAALIKINNQYQEYDQFKAETEIALFSLISRIGWEELRIGHYKSKKHPVYSKPERYTGLAERVAQLETLNTKLKDEQEIAAKQAQKHQNELDKKEDEKNKLVADLKAEQDSYAEQAKKHQQVLDQTEDEKNKLVADLKAEQDNYAEQAKKHQQVLDQTEGEKNKLVADLKAEQDNYAEQAKKHQQVLDQTEDEKNKLVADLKAEQDSYAEQAKKHQQVLDQTEDEKNKLVADLKAEQDSYAEQAKKHQQALNQKENEKNQLASELEAEKSRAAEQAKKNEAAQLVHKNKKITREHYQLKEDAYFSVHKSSENDQLAVVFSVLTESVIEKLTKPQIVKICKKFNINLSVPAKAKVSEMKEALKTIAINKTSSPEKSSERMETRELTLESE